MKRTEVVALAAAFAAANGHSDVDDYAQSVADAYVEPDAATPESDLKSTIADAKAARAKE